jgi:uncharacterized protein YdhG (YjbR/CyaY superfamily)
MNEYIDKFPEEVKQRLLAIKRLVKKIVPNAEETMAYGLPTFKLFGNLVHFGGFKNHIGFYPVPSGLKAFKKELANYKTSKGAVQFQNSEKLPLDLIEKIVKFRVEENMVASFGKIGMPATNAFLHTGIKSINDIPKYSEADLLKIHGVGPKAISILKTSLRKYKLKLKSN